MFIVPTTTLTISFVKWCALHGFNCMLIIMSKLASAKESCHDSPSFGRPIIKFSSVYIVTNQVVEDEGDELWAPAVGQLVITYKSLSTNQSPATAIEPGNRFRGRILLCVLKDPEHRPSQAISFYVQRYSGTDSTGGPSRR